MFKPSGWVNIVLYDEEKQTKKKFTFSAAMRNCIFRLHYLNKK